MAGPGSDAGLIELTVEKPQNLSHAFDPSPLVLRALPPPIGLFVDQGLLIVGWVANWRRIEIVLYDWRPLWRDQKLFTALGRMEIGFRPFEAECSTQGVGG